MLEYQIPLGRSTGVLDPLLGRSTGVLDPLGPEYWSTGSPWAGVLEYGLVRSTEYRPPVLLVTPLWQPRPQVPVGGVNGEAEAVMPAPPPIPLHSRRIPSTFLCSPSTHASSIARPHRAHHGWNAPPRVPNANAAAHPNRPAPPKHAQRCESS